MDWNYPLTRYVYRPVSVPIAGLLARTPVGPTEVSIGSALLCLAGAVAFARSAYVLGVILTFAGSITDCVDGDLARLTGRTSPRGALLDSVLDRWTDAALIIGLALSDLDRYGAAALLALTGSFLTSYSRARAQSLGIDSPDGIGTRDVRMFILMVAALVDAISFGLIAVAVLGALTSIQRTAQAFHGLDRDAGTADHPGAATTGPGPPER
jgi:phosphatidylglycerophosphate synthase